MAGAAAHEPCGCGTAPALPDQLVCRTCLTPLALGRPPRTILATRRARIAHRLEIVFDGGTVELAAGEEVELGRDPATSPYAHLLTDDTVSHRHLVVALRTDGSAWVTDLGSTNHTYVNGVRLTPRTPSPVRSGDRLRLAMDIRAGLRIVDHGASG
ncbi:FHA domain-containing protein [Kitasatospora hibisci]|uniref:FHA domain-containing protein n=1 Tax=Kitasatospora hibisci TaxID=3369522 RepID=UPI0037541E82